MRPVVEIVRLAPIHASALEVFFSALVQASDDRYFHPHPFSQEHAKIIAGYEGEDLYYGAMSEETIIAYGMLRGWDEGFAVPSLGIAVLPSYRGISLGKAMMHFLHIAAAMRGVDRVRLTVDPSNTSAIRLYESLGYTFIAEKMGRLVGSFRLHPIINTTKMQ